MHLEQLSWTDVQDLSTQVAVLPVGSIEQHGPHSPLNTDLIIARELARAATNRTEALYIPPVNYGTAENHRHFDGTISLSPKTLRSLIRDILISVNRWGIESTVIVNGHGGNTASINEVCHQVYRNNDVFATEWLWARAIGVMESVDHGGELETSLVMYLDEELVSELPDSSPHSNEETVAGSEVRGYDTIDFSNEGYFGEPKCASVETGKKVFKNSVDKLVELITHLE